MYSIQLHFDCLKAKYSGKAPTIFDNPDSVCKFWEPTPQFPWKCSRPPMRQCPCHVSRKACGGVALAE